MNLRITRNLVSKKFVQYTLYVDLIALNEITPSLLLKLNTEGVVNLNQDQEDILNEVIKSSVNFGTAKKLDQRLLDEMPEWVLNGMICLNSYDIGTNEKGDVSRKGSQYNDDQQQR